MSIECSFCSTAKSERYLYTECGHLVCMNCAALRASENLQCCNVMTELDEGVKTLLREKKDKILSNLQNQYKYETKDINKIGLIQLDQKLKIIDNMQNRPRRKYQEEYEPDITTAEDQQLKQTPIDQFYKNPLILEKHRYQVPQTTPIKMVLNSDEYDDGGNYQHRDTFNPMILQKVLRTQEQPSKRNEKKERQIKSNPFNSVLQKTIGSVRSEFKKIYEQLQKMEANIVYQMKIYFQEYLNLIQKENSNQLSPSQFIEIEIDRISNFLDQFVQEWNLKDITKLLSSKQRIITSNFIKEPQKFAENQILDKRKIIYSNSVQPLQSCQMNQQISHIKNDIQDDFLDKLRLSEFDETSNKVQKTNVAGRNLDRIYKKLEESRSKLQERIQIHNEFMNKKCIKLGNY